MFLGARWATLSFLKVADHEEVADHEAILSLAIRFLIRKECLTMGSEIHCVPLLALLLCRALPLLHLDLLPHGFAF